MLLYDGLVFLGCRLKARIEAQVPETGINREIKHI